MPQQVQQKPIALQSGSVLLALTLLALCLPATAMAQVERSDPKASSEQTPQVNEYIAEVIEAESKLELKVDLSKLIRTKVPVTRFSITEPRIVDVVQFSPTEFEVMGLHPGRTSFTLWFGENKAIRYLVKVLPNRFDDVERIDEVKKLERKINELFPNSMVQLIPFEDKVIVRGQVRDSAEASQILSLLSDRNGGNNRNGNRNNYNRAANYRGNDLGLGGLANRGVSDVLSQNVISLLDVPGEQQVMLKVRVAELSRTALRNMSVQGTINSGILAMNTSSGGLSAVFSSVMTPQELSLALTAASSTGYTKVLAEPNLVTLNGQAAKFLAGGKFPVPTAVGIGGVSGINTQFQSFGAELSFTPTIIDKDRIRLVVTPSFSTVNQSLSVEGIPGLNSRSVDTTVDMRVGQWLAIAGLLQDETISNKKRVPFVGDLPVVGTLFGQTSSQRNETELIILVSPELVHPMDAREVPLVLPGMEIAEPGDVAFFLGGANVAKANPPGSQSAQPCQTQPCGPEDTRRAIRQAMSRPEYQRSEKSNMYGEHGTSR